MILVTGGAGFVGSNLVDSLIEQGYGVVIIDDLSTGKFNNINPKAQFIQHNVQDFEFGRWLRHNHNPEIIFHMAALARIQPSFHNAQETFKSNCSATINVLEYAKNCGAKVIYPGSSSAYHDIYANPYTFTKWAGEEQCKLYNKVYGVSVGIARFFNVYGPRQIEDGAYSTVVGVFEKQKREGKPLTVTGDGEQRRDFTHVQDIVDGLIALSKRDNQAEIFNFGTGKNYSINEVAMLFGGPIQYIPKRPGEALTTLADISEASEKLGYQPKHSLEEYIKNILPA